PSDTFSLSLHDALPISGMVARMPATPVATVLFALVTGTAAAASFAFDGDFAFSAMTAAFIAVAVSGTIESSRTYLSAKIAEAGVDRKSTRLNSSHVAIS